MSRRCNERSSPENGGFWASSDSTIRWASGPKKHQTQADLREHFLRIIRKGLPGASGGAGHCISTENGDPFPLKGNRPSGHEYRFCVWRERSIKGP